MRISVLLLCACAVRYTLAFATGAPLEACATISPALGHTSPPNEAVGASPTTLDLNGLNNGLFYCPAESYTVTLNSLAEATTFQGLLVQARLEADDSPVGQFSNFTPDTRQSNCIPPESAVTHSNFRFRLSEQLTWTAPPPGSGPINFWYTISRFYNESVSNLFYDNLRSGVIPEGVPGIHCGCNQINSSLSIFVLDPGQPSCFHCIFENNPIPSWSINRTVIDSSSIDVQVQGNGVLSVLNPEIFFSTSPINVQCVNPLPDVMVAFHDITVFLRVTLFEFTQVTYLVMEGMTSVSVTVMATSGAVNRVIEVIITTKIISAQASSDFVATPIALMFNPGDTSHSVSIAIIDDAVIESTEVFNISLSSTDPNSIVGPDSRVIINDNDIAEFAFTSPSYTYFEDVGSAEVGVHLVNGTLDRSVEVTVIASHLMANDPGDLLATTMILRFSPGDSQQVTFLTIVDDTVVEDPELLNLSLNSTDPSVVIGENSSILILDNDIVELEFTQPQYTVLENELFAVLVVKIRNGFLNRSVSYSVTPNSLQATDQEDFLGSPETFFFFPTDIEQPILIIIVDDSIVESSELFNVVLNSTDPSVNFFAESTEVLIIDDNVNDVAEFAFTLPSYTVPENVGTVNVGVSLVNGILDRSVVVTIMPSSVQAFDIDDFLGTPVQLSFFPGNTSQSALIPIIDDEQIEGPELFNLLLNSTDPSARISPMLSKVLIVDNEAKCSTGEWACVGPGDNRCIPEAWLCDGISDCPTGIDEVVDECISISSSCSQLSNGQLKLLAIESSELRTSLGISPPRGLLQVCINGVRGGIRADGWNVDGTNVACRQLGLGPVGYPVVYSIDQFRSVLADVRCSGNETDLVSCQATTLNGSIDLNIIGEFFARDFAGIQCQAQNNCYDGQLRLTGGRSEREGRVEICYNSIWGHIIDFDLRYQDAAVVCRQLGYDPLGALPLIMSSFGRAPEPLWLNGIGCNGNETSLLDCDGTENIGAMNGFSSQNLIGVQCNELQQECSDGDVRLVPRLLQNAGQVQVCINNTWGAVCGLPWSQSEASVVCRQLNFSHPELSIGISSPITTIASGPVHLRDVVCNGSESNLLECFSRSASQHNICSSHIFDASVACVDSPTVAVRLNSGRSTLFNVHPGNTDIVIDAELGRPFILSCSVDNGPYTFAPILDSFSPQDIIPTMLSLNSSTHSQVPVIITDMASEEISGIYKCIAENSVRLRTVQTITINVLLTSLDAATAFLRISVVTLTRIQHIFNNNITAQDLNSIIQNSLLNTLDEDLPGIQMINCFRSERFRRMIDVERDYDRIECVLSTSPAGDDGSSYALMLAKVAGTSFAKSIPAFLHSPRASESGFCDSNDLNDQYWEEAQHGSEVVQPCPGESTIQGGMARRQCTTMGWEPPQLNECARVVLFCDSEKESSSYGNYTWPMTREESVQMLPCQVASIDTVTYAIRACMINGEWAATDFSRCITIVEMELSILENKIQNENITVENVEEIIRDLNTIISDADTPEEQTVDNVAIVSIVLAGTAALVSGITDMTVEDTVQILDRIDEWPKESVMTQSNEIIKSFETIAITLAEEDNFTSLMIVTNDIVVFGERVQVQELQNGRGFSSSRSVNGALDSMSGTNQTTSLATDEVVSAFLPSSLFDRALNESITVLFTLYDNPSSLFPVRIESNPQEVDSGEVTFVGTPVIGIIIPSLINNVQNLTDPVEILLRISTPLSENDTITNITCVFWDFTLNGNQGGWSDSGCETSADLDNPDIVTCQCNHLTNFAALVDICSRVDGCQQLSRGAALALDIISIIGVSLSILGLVITVITLLVFKKLRKRDATKFHVQLSIAILCMMLVFVIGVDRTEIYGGCVAVSVLIHYFTLVSVMWMGAEAILMFQKLVIVFTQITTKYIVVVSIICWTLPLIPVVIPLAISRDFMVTYQRDTNELDFCFISHIAVFFGAFLGLIFSIIIFNCVIFVIVIIVLVRHQVSTMERKNERMNTKTAVRLLISIIGVMFLFGLTWLFGALTVTGATLAFQVLFAIFNSLQGFFIFLFFCVCSKDARELWKETLTCKSCRSNSSYTSRRSRSGVSSIGLRKNNTAGTLSTGAAISTLGYATTTSEFDNTTADLIKGEGLHYDTELRGSSTFKRSRAVGTASGKEIILNVSPIKTNEASSSSDSDDPIKGGGLHYDTELRGSSTFKHSHAIGTTFDKETKIDACEVYENQANSHSDTEGVESIPSASKHLEPPSDDFSSLGEFRHTRGITKHEGKRQYETYEVDFELNDEETGIVL